MPDNTITIVGNVTRGPELRFTASGQAANSFGLAVNRRWQNRQTQEWEEAVSFFDVTCWQDLAENVAETVSKGARVIVAGRLVQRSWETDTGERRSRVEVVADEVGPSLRWAVARSPRTSARAMPNRSLPRGRHVPPSIRAGAGQPPGVNRRRPLSRATVRPMPTAGSRCEPTNSDPHFSLRARRAADQLAAANLTRGNSRRRSYEDALGASSRPRDVRSTGGQTRSP
jgi:single-strand DNA-binding protein